MARKCPSGNFCLKALEEIRHGLPNKASFRHPFNFLIWKNELNQTHVSGQTLTLQLHFRFEMGAACFGLVSSSPE